MLAKYLTTENIWFGIGFFGQGFFMMRFVVQWLQSEKQKRSVIPVAFWFFSIGGGLITLTYAIYRKDPVFIAGQGLGLVIYARNMWFVFLDKKHPHRKPENRMRTLLEDLSTRVNDPAIDEMKKLLAS